MSEGLGIAFVRLEREKQAEAVLTRNLLPWQTSESALQGPQEVEGGVCASGLDEPIGAN